ncbi:unnamed protein product [Caenorhabditis brenneri]
MTETSQLSIYEKMFAKSDKTDAILVVDGKKFHVNKALLSYHSDYFNVLFNSDFKEKSMAEIPIEDVNFADFAAVLSLVLPNPIRRPIYHFDPFLDLADRFQLPAAKRHLELFLITSTKSSDARIVIADKYQLNNLMDITLSKYQEGDYWDYSYRNGSRFVEYKLEMYRKLSDETNIKLFHRYLEVNNKTTKKPKPETPAINIYEKTFANSEKTDAVLVVDGKKLHVNKAVLSYHSDYFNSLFNSEFKKKPVEEIEIKDVKFEDFSTLLSLIHLNPISPTEENAMNILELSDRFIIPCAKYYLEPFIIISKLTSLEKIRIGEKYELSDLFQNGIDTLKSADFTELPSNPIYQTFSSRTKRKLFEKSLGCLFYS